ncbi:hypothetical protein PNK_0633 [Candidatus Protochlamydia naegleriophila]|uniref:Uncharacterized protein n=1 Tax=Candidatus Protochlamydia naegleriophila TaxID=389348 RepID=A0A0U5JBT8_9BACT|nr:hypothetical protein PNK_0633 [Candidatus Protochlamydia naegleriophila]
MGLLVELIKKATSNLFKIIFCLKNGFSYRVDKVLAQHNLIYLKNSNKLSSQCKIAPYTQVFEKLAFCGKEKKSRFSEYFNV